MKTNNRTHNAIEYLIYPILQTLILYLMPIFYVNSQKATYGLTAYLVLGFIIIYELSNYLIFFHQNGSTRRLHLLAFSVEIIFGIMTILIANLYLATIIVCIAVISNLPFIFDFRISSIYFSSFVESGFIPLLLQNIIFFSIYGYISRPFFTLSLIFSLLLLLSEFVNISKKTSKLLMIIISIIVIFSMSYTTNLSLTAEICICVASIAYWIAFKLANKKALIKLLYQLLIILILLLLR